LVLAGLIAEGETEVSGLHHIDRGYVNFTEKLRALGADVERITSEPVAESEVTAEPIKVSFSPNFA
jgi:UDP-N-acetylglucosamine 1-carboxyvinyltransferase